MRAADTAAAEELARAASLPQMVAELLLARGIATPEAAAAFLAPSLEHLHDPFLMLGMDRAVTRIRQAIESGEAILIYGDYDVDGTIAIVLLKTALERLHARIGPTDTQADVRYHVPHRILEGYGMQMPVLADASVAGVKLVISVDTGIRAFAAADEATRLNLDLIVTDHHLPDDERMPDAVAVINPNQHGCNYPFKHLCGAGVAFKLAQALLESTQTPCHSVAGPEQREGAAGESASSTANALLVSNAKLLLSFLKLLAIATIADAVPLLDENRVIATIGLRELRSPVQPGLRALMQLADLNSARPLTPTDVGFRLAPRINAAGRMDIASDVVELFLTREPVRARELAEKLHRLNDERRATEAEALLTITKALDTLLAEDPMLERNPSIVVDSELWHRGVIGILAARVVERMHRPALVITHEEGEAYGSGRSIPGFHLLNALTAIEDSGHIFTRFGGHAHAVGFSLPSPLVPLLRERMRAYADKLMTPAMRTPELLCDAELPLDRITPALVGWLRRFEPFGMENREPVLVAYRVRITAAPRIMKEKHIRLRVQQGPRGSLFNAVGWGRNESWGERSARLGLAEGVLIDLVYKIRENTDPDFAGTELEVCDLRLAEPEQQI